MLVSLLSAAVPDGDLFGPQTSVKYTLIGSDGARAVFNDSADPDFVGVLEGEDAVTGLEAPELRESVEDRPDAHGASHGVFYAGRRPVTMNGRLVPAGLTDAAAKLDRNRRLSKFLRASRSMTRDGMLLWQVDGGYEMQINVRRQQPPRTPGAWTKALQLALVAEDPLIYSREWQRTVAGPAQFLRLSMDGVTVARDLNGNIVPGAAGWGTEIFRTTVTNAGSAGTVLDYHDPGAPAIISVTGVEGSNLGIVNATQEAGIFLAPITLFRHDTVVIDTGTGNVTLNGANANGVVSMPYTRGFGLVHGPNDLRMFLGSGMAASLGTESMMVEYRHAWM